MNNDEIEKLAYLLYKAIEGDDVNEQAFSVLRKLDFIDENQEWIYRDDE